MGTSSYSYYDIQASLLPAEPHIAHADAKITLPHQRGYALGRQARHQSWLESEAHKRKHKISNIVMSVLSRITPEGRLAQDDFFVLDAARFSPNLAKRRIPGLSGGIKEMWNKSIVPLWTLRLTPHQRAIRSAILKIMSHQDAAKIHQVDWQPLIRPHQLYGGPLRNWQYRCMTGDQYCHYGSGQPGYPIVDKRDNTILRMLIPQSDTGAAFYLHGE